jgi:Fungal Zn(2)-Cys(6) binuclear cluster domain
MSFPYESQGMHGSMNGMQAVQVQTQKAPQACMSCRKQKRKCSKDLPACALCNRMNRHCDYSDSSPPPTSEDFNALRMKVLELESKQFGINGVMNQPSPYATPSSLPPREMHGPQGPAYTPPQEPPWQGIRNEFPAIAFLDREVFMHGG